MKTNPYRVKLAKVVPIAKYALYTCLLVLFYYSLKTAVTAETTAGSIIGITCIVLSAFCLWSGTQIIRKTEQVLANEQKKESS